MNSKVLIIEPYCPLPTNSGGKVRIKNTLIELSKNNQIDLICFYQDDRERKYTNSFLKKHKIKVTYIPTISKKHFSYFANHQPYWFSVWYSRDLISLLINTDFKQYQTVLIETSQLMYLVKYIPKKIKTIYTAYDISTVSFYRRWLESGLFKKIITFTYLIEIYLYEKIYFSKFQQVITVSTNDRTFLQNIFNTSSVVIENGIEHISFLPTSKNKDEIIIGFIGSISHPPNKKAIDFLTTKIADSLNDIKQKYKIILVTDKYFNNKKNNINNLGYVDNLKTFYQQIDILVAPIFSGSGSRIKILESLSFGKFVITTKIGSEGINIDTNYLTIVPSNKQTNPKVWTDIIINKSKTIPDNNLKNILLKITWGKVLRQLVKLVQQPTS